MNIRLNNFWIGEFLGIIWGIAFDWKVVKNASKLMKNMEYVWTARNPFLEFGTQVKFSSMRIYIGVIESSR